MRGGGWQGGKNRTCMLEGPADGNNDEAMDDGTRGCGRKQVQAERRGGRQRGGGLMRPVDGPLGFERGQGVVGGADRRGGGGSRW